MANPARPAPFATAFELASIEAKVNAGQRSRSLQVLRESRSRFLGAHVAGCGHCSDRLGRFAPGVTRWIRVGCLEVNADCS